MSYWTPRDSNGNEKYNLEGAKRRTDEKKKKAKIISSLRDPSEFYNIDDSDEDDDDDDDGDGVSRLEKAQLKHALKESRQIAAEEHRHSVSGSRPSVSGMKRPHLSKSWTMKEGVDLPTKGIDLSMFRTKKSTQKTVKAMFTADGVKKVGKAISKFFHFNAIPFNVADSGPVYQHMIDTIAEVGPGIKGPTGYQIGGVYLDEEVKEVDDYIGTLKAKWPEYGCTIMCDGWSSRTKKSIINFMVYCDRNMIYHSSVDTTDQSKTAEYIFSLMDKVVEEVGETHVVHVVTDNGANFKAAGALLMEKRRHLFWSPCAAHCIDLMLEDIGKMKPIKAVLDDAKSITSFIYNSQKVVNLMREYTRDRELLRPGITRFATEFIALESLIRYQSDLKRMCTTDEWREFNRERSRRSVAAKVSDLILTDQFWKRAAEVHNIMEPLVLILKVVDQDKKPTLSVIYEGMDRAKLALKATVKNWKRYWQVIDVRWEGQLHRHLHAAAYFLNPIFQYSKNFSNHPEVRVGLKEVIKRLEPDLEKQARAINELFNISTTVDPSYVISLIRKLLPSGVSSSINSHGLNACDSPTQGSKAEGTEESVDEYEAMDTVNEFGELDGQEGRDDRSHNQDKHEGASVGGEGWEDYGCILWDLATSKTHAELMVQNLVLEVLLASLMVSQSARVTEISLGIIGNLACHEVSRKHISSTKGLIDIIVDQLFLDDTPCLCEAFRLLTLCLQGSEGVTWAEALQHEHVLSRVLWVAENTLNPQLIERSVGLLLAISESQQEVINALLPRLMKLGLPSLLTNLFAFEMSKLTGERVPERYSLIDLILRTIEALSVIDDYSQELCSNKELFQLLNDLIKLPDKIEFASCCVTAAVLMANILSDATDLALEISHDMLYLQGLLDIYSFTSDDIEARSALWSIVARLLVRVEESEMSPSSLHQYVSVLVSKSDLIEEELFDLQLDDSNVVHESSTSGAKLNARTTALRRIFSILSQWIAIKDHVKGSTFLVENHVNEGDVDRLLDCCIKYTKSNAGSGVMD